MQCIAKPLLFSIIFVGILLCFTNIVVAKQIFRETITFSENITNNSILIRSKRPNERINLTYPGTKWCGPGNTASDYNDLGDYADVDKCCRAHDHCDNIPAGESRHNLTNHDFFSSLHCDCDREFYECLHSINTRASNQIGKLYFTLRNKCYQNEYPIVECVDYDTSFFLRRCHRYLLDENLFRLYQWFDLPLYDGKMMERNESDDFISI